jgi:thymidine phosphorylase
MVSVGDKVERGQSLCVAHAADDDAAQAAALADQSAITIGESPAAMPLIIERIDP